MVEKNVQEILGVEQKKLFDKSVRVMSELANKYVMLSEVATVSGLMQTIENKHSVILNTTTEELESMSEDDRIDFDLDYRTIGFTFPVDSDIFALDIGRSTFVDDLLSTLQNYKVELLVEALSVLKASLNIGIEELLDECEKIEEQQTMRKEVK